MFDTHVSSFLQRNRLSSHLTTFDHHQFYTNSCKNDDTIFCMGSIEIIEELQNAHGGNLLLTGLAAIQSPMVQTRQLTFFSRRRNKEDFFIGRYHVVIRRTTKKTINITDHIYFIARHVEFYADEIDQLVAVLPDIPLKDIVSRDKAWRIIAYLKKHCLGEKIALKQSIGRRLIYIGDFTSIDAVNDGQLNIRDGLLVPTFKSIISSWMPKFSDHSDHGCVDRKIKESNEYFKIRKARPLFHKFCRYASKLESAASAMIEGYDARIEPSSLTNKLSQRLKSNIALRAHLNMDNLHRDIIRLSKEPFSIELLCHLQKAIVWETWKNHDEKKDKAIGTLRPFDVVIVDRSKSIQDHVVFVAPKHQDVMRLLRELIDFYYRMRVSMHPLDLAAIFKCQLAIIHPFGDGNGRLARWCFQSILVREGYIDSVYQAPVSQILLQQKKRYYDELERVDSHIMNEVKWTMDAKTKRYQAIYDNRDIYRDLDYSTWIKYVHDVFMEAVDFSMEEHQIFEHTESIFESFEKILKTSVDAGMKHQILRAIDIGLRARWGKKTEKRLANIGLSINDIMQLYQIIMKHNPNG